MIKKLFTVALFCACLFAFNFSTQAKSRMSARYPYIQNERLLPLALREIYDAQNIYQETAGNGNFGNFFQLIDSGLLNRTWQTSVYQKYGYIFQINTVDRVFGTNYPASFNIKAYPRRYRKTGRKSFYVDYSGVMRAGDKNGAEASGDEPVIGNFPYTVFNVRNDSRIVNTMRLLHSAQVTYQAINNSGNFATLDQLYTTGLINQYLRTSRFGGYNFVIAKRDSVQGTSPAVFNAKATPDQYTSTGVRSFYIDETGVIRGADKGGAPATADDPAIEK